MIAKWKLFRENHPEIYEFIMFNLLANIATITNFIVLFVGNNFLFISMREVIFQWGPFDYSVANGGLCGFLSFLLSYGTAQTVNFIVQRKAVFHANNKLCGAVIIYVVAVLIVYGICLYVPTIIMTPLSRFIGNFAPYAANCVNILIQFIILFPTMKYLVMKKQ